MSDTKLAQILTDYAPKGASSDLLNKISPLVKERMKRFTEFSDLAGFFFSEPVIDAALLSSNAKVHLQNAKDGLSAISNFTSENMNEVLMGIVRKNEFKASDFFMDLRIAITGKKVTPPLNESMEILGRESVLLRIQNAIQ